MNRDFFMSFKEKKNLLYHTNSIDVYIFYCKTRFLSKTNNT